MVLGRGDSKHASGKLVVGVLLVMLMAALAYIVVPIFLNPPPGILGNPSDPSWPPSATAVAPPAPAPATTSATAAPPAGSLER